MFILVDTGLSYLNIYINNWYVKAVEKAKMIQKYKDKHSKSVIKRKVTQYQSKLESFWRLSQSLIFCLIL